MVDYIVDTEKAIAMNKELDAWGKQPEIAKDLVPAREDATNLLMSLVLTGIEVGLFRNNEFSNQVLLYKLSIAFDMGYYAHHLKFSAKEGGGR
jgi:hypothetical protein